MNEVERALSGFEIFGNLDQEQLSLLAQGAEPVSFAADERILSTDEPAEQIYAVLSGRVAIEIDGANRGPLIIETIGSGDVAGISWLLPPHRWTFDARAVNDVTAIALDAAGLRQACDRHPVFGYEIYKRFAGLVHRRLVATRLRVIDLYGSDVSGR